MEESRSAFPEVDRRRITVVILILILRENPRQNGDSFLHILADLYSISLILDRKSDIDENPKSCEGYLYLITLH